MLRFEQIRESGDSVEVTLPLARIVIRDAAIVLSLPGLHDGPVVTLSFATGHLWQLVKASPDTLHLRRPGESLSLGSDGFLSFQGEPGGSLQVVRHFEIQDGAVRQDVCDLRGRGFGLGLYRSAPHGSNWSGSLSYSDRDPLQVHLFPPRAEDKRRIGQRIAHEGRPAAHRRFPSHELIQAVAPHAEIFALHGYFWKELDSSLRPRFSRYRFRLCPWLSPRHIPENEEELVRVRRQVEEAGMVFLPYVSPRYSTAPDMLEEIERLQKLWNFDGYYLDGLRGDFLEQRKFIRALRRLLGWSRIIYLNGSNQPFGHPAFTAPFIDTHCDFVLRGDSGRGDLGRDEFLRRCVSGRGAGNQVGVWCHYGSSGWPFPFDRVPSRSDQEAALRHGVQIWRRSFWWPGPRALVRFDAFNSRTVEHG